MASDANCFVLPTPPLLSAAGSTLISKGNINFDLNGFPVGEHCFLWHRGTRIFMKDMLVKRAVACGFIMAVKIES